ncbi:hypothetical protein PVAND_012984 [Polypedilum vanderplanki]|uniref:Uncharacterized protein n=1 Tax=Polypedilum vanderplanki TaxID=319348 RepID=A0A9J6CPC7_POLVA|nr:hypothetical protein PVAND_012984 [Polypedilum vanderplanki]
MVWSFSETIERLLTGLPQFLIYLYPLALLRMIFSSKIRNIFGLYLISIVLLQNLVYFPLPLFRIHNFGIFYISYGFIQIPMSTFLFASIMFYAEIRRRYFLKFLKKNYFVIMFLWTLIIAASWMVYYFLSTVRNVEHTRNVENLIIPLSVAISLILFCEFLKLKLLHKKRIKAHEEENPENVSSYYDINKDEKNIIFLMSLTYIFNTFLMLFAIYFNRYFRRNYSKLYKMTPETKNFGNIFMTIIAVSYVEERLNLNFLFK